MATPNMSLVLPTDHGSADTWDTILDTVFGLIDAHDHTTGKGVKVPSAALNINADLALASFALTGGKGYGLTPVTAASVAAYTDLFFVNSSDANNLYFRNHASTNIRITNGSTLDLTLVGGIGGDYSSVGALLDFDDASDTYRLRQQIGSAVRQFAKMSSADVNLFEYKANPAAGVPANAVTLKSPAGLGAPYSITFPTALPAATSSLYISSAGVVSTKPTLTLAINAMAGQNRVPANLAIGVGPKWVTVAGGGTASLQIAMPVVAGYVLTGYTAYVRKTTAGTNSLTTTIGEWDGTTGAFTANVTPGTGTETSAANNPGFITLFKTGLNFTVASGGKSWVFTFSNTASSASDEFHSVEFTYQPV